MGSPVRQLEQGREYEKGPVVVANEGEEKAKVTEEEETG